MVRKIHEVITQGRIGEIIQAFEEGKKICLKAQDAGKKITARVTKDSANPHEVEVLTFHCITRDNHKQSSSDLALVFDVDHGSRKAFYATYSGFPYEGSEHNNIERPKRLDMLKSWLNKGWQGTKKLISSDGDSKSIVPHILDLFVEHKMCFFAGSTVISPQDSNKYLSVAKIVCITNNNRSGGVFKDYAVPKYITGNICEAVEKNKDLFSAMLVNIEDLCLLTEITGNAAVNNDYHGEL